MKIGNPVGMEPNDTLHGRENGMMKKLSALLLAAVLLLSAAGYAEATDLLGDWYLNTIVMEGTSVSAADMGYEMTMSLNEDGTVHIDAMGEAEEGTWKEEGGNVVIDTEYEAMTFTVGDDGSLTVDEGGVIMIFTREAPGPGFTPAELARVKEELRKEKLRADAYDTMIDIAEDMFKVPIRKKAGAKR